MRLGSPACLVLALGAFCLTGCSCEELTGFFSEPTPDVSHPQRFDKDGLSFDFPGNWKAEEDRQREGAALIRTVTVHSTGNALVLVQVLEPAVPLDANSYLDEMLPAMQSELKESAGGLVKASETGRTPVTGRLAGAPASGMAGRFDIAARGEKVPTQLEVLSVERKHGTLIVGCLTAIEDLPKAQPACDQIRGSVAYSAAP